MSLSVSIGHFFLVCLCRVRASSWGPGALTDTPFRAAAANIARRMSDQLLGGLLECISQTYLPTSADDAEAATSVSRSPLSLLDQTSADPMPGRWGSFFAQPSAWHYSRTKDVTRTSPYSTSQWAGWPYDRLNPKLSQKPSFLQR